MRQDEDSANNESASTADVIIRGTPFCSRRHKRPSNSDAAVSIHRALIQIKQISLLSIAHKVLARIANSYLKPVASDNQEGEERPSTPGEVPRAIQPLCLAFIDVTKSSDSVSRPLL